MICPFITDLPISNNRKKGWPWTEEAKRCPAKMSGDTAWPKLTIVTPSYNQGRYLEETIRSILLQGYPDLNYIIMDGGSTDNSKDILRKYDAWITCWESEKDRGQCHAINKGWEKAKPGVWAWINSDDFYMPDTFYKAVSALHENLNIDLVYSSANYVDEGSSIVGKKYSAFQLPKGIDRMKFWEGWPIPQPTVFFNSSLVGKYGKLDENFRFALDYEWFQRVGRNQDFLFMDDIWAAYRRHDEAKSGTGSGWEEAKKSFYPECRKANYKHTSLINYFRLKHDEYLYNKKMKESMKYRRQSVWHQKFELLPNPKYEFGVPHGDKRIHKAVIKDLKDANYEVVDYKIDHSDYYRYLEKAKYKENFPEYQKGGKSKFFTEKSLEHYLAAKFLDLSSADVYLDITSSGSPTPEIYQSLYGCNSFKQDLIYKKGLHGTTIGGYAADMAIPDNFVSKIALHSSFEHFEKDADVRFIYEVNRVLKPGGKMCIIPLYLFNKYAIQTDPSVFGDETITFEEEAVLYCANGWKNRHARFYDVFHLGNRIRNNLGDLKLTIYNFTNVKALNDSCYVKFAGMFEKSVERK